MRRSMILSGGERYKEVSLIKRGAVMRECRRMCNCDWNGR